MSLLDLLKERLLILLTGDEELVREVIATEKSIFRAFLAVFRRFRQENGRLVRDENSVSQMARIRRALLQVISESTLDQKIEAFLPNFERVEELTNDIYQDILDGGTIPELDAFRALAIDQMLSAFDERRGLDPAYIIPLQRRIFETVQLQMPFTEAVQYIRAYIVGTGNNGGELAKYSRTIATDLINGYSAFADYQIAKANNLDGFYFSGSLIDTSRQTCIDMVEGAGEFEDLAIEPGLFAVEDVDKIVERARDNSGFRPETTEETYFIFRNGYNCRHFMVFTYLSDEERSTRERIRKAVEGLKDFAPDE